MHLDHEGHLHGDPGGGPLENACTDLGGSDESSHFFVVSTMNRSSVTSQITRASLTCRHFDAEYAIKGQAFGHHTCQGSI